MNCAPCLCCLARTSRVAPGQLRGLLSLLEEADLPERVRGDAAELAAELGFGLDPVLRMLDALYEAGAIDGDNSPVIDPARHGDASPTSPRHGDVSVTSGDADRLARLRAVSRRSSAKYRAKLRASGYSTATYPQTYPVTGHRVTLEEEREISEVSSLAQARDPASEQRAMKRTALWARCVEAAPRHLGARDLAWFLEHASNERYELFLARGTGGLNVRFAQMIERLIEATKWRGAGKPPRPPDSRQPSIYLPIPGGNGRDYRVQSDYREGERLTG